MRQKLKEQKLLNAKVGDYVFFGAYEQDNNTSNGKEEIEWLVLDKKDGKILVISKYILDCEKYQNDWNVYYHSTNTWDNSSLRTWLNEDFINEAFSSTEKSRIPTVTVSAEKNPSSYSDYVSAKETQDKIFLLSYTEAEKYFSSDDARECVRTNYATKKSSLDYWWLRTEGFFSDSPVTVSSSGQILTKLGRDANSIEGVRPAMWIDLAN